MTDCNEPRDFGSMSHNGGVRRLAGLFARTHTGAGVGMKIAWVCTENRLHSFTNLFAR